MKFDYLKRLLLLPLAARYVQMPGRSHRGALAPLAETERQIERTCRTHVTALAQQPRFTAQQLQAAADYIERQLGALGYTVQRQSFPLRQESADNLIAELPGTTSDVFIVGAHYDTVPHSCGANDNASGVAAMLELARLLKDAPRSATVRFIAFANEEHIKLPAETMGSYIYAAECARRQERISGMWSLETLAYYCDAENSQHYPAPFHLFYPTIGNFVAFVGNYASRRLVRRSVSLFRNLSGFPAEGVASPDKHRDVTRSDQWGFWQSGYPALMITDTANFRYPHYHTTEDTPDKLSYECLARVVFRLAKVLSVLIA